MNRAVPPAKSIWQHVSNNDIYQVLHVTKGAGKLRDETIIVYQNLVTKEVYTRRLDEWEINFINMDKTVSFMVSGLADAFNEKLTGVAGILRKHLLGKKSE